MKKSILLAFPNPKSLSVLRVNLLCSVQILPWLKITPLQGPSKVKNGYLFFLNYGFKITFLTFLFYLPYPLGRCYS